MSLKETIINALVLDGYDTLTAAEKAAAILKEIAAMPAGKHIIYAGTRIVTEITFSKK